MCTERETDEVTHAVRAATKQRWFVMVRLMTLGFSIVCF